MDAAGRLASWALLLLPGGLTIYLSFNGGGFFPNTQAFAALVLAAALGLRIAFAEEPFAGFSKPLGVAVGGPGPVCVVDPGVGGMVRFDGPRAARVQPRAALPARAGAVRLAAAHGEQFPVDGARVWRSGSSWCACAGW